MDKKTRCIVLRTVKYGDDKLIIDFLTREEGRLSALWKMNTSAKAKVRRQLFQPLTLLEVDFERVPRQSLCKIKEARMAYMYASLPFDGIKLSIAFFLAEFLCYATRDQHSDGSLYDFVEQSLLWLDNTDRGVHNFHLMFMIRLSRFLGFHPDADSYEEGALFDLREGCFVPSVPFHTDFLNSSDAFRLLTLLRISPANLHLFRMTRTERNHAIDTILHFYRIHIPAFGEMKTLEVLRSL
ncbi:MAG: DNA repair protein RecO [Prevotella sp.]|nr:DNA repair protein RecO [Candidatus Prevotella equi]